MVGRIFGSISGFGTGVIGNLLATWLVGEHSFTATPQFLIPALVLALLGLIIGAIFDQRRQNMPVVTTSKHFTPNSTSTLFNLKSFWSKIKGTGHGIHLDNVLSIGSDIEINAVSTDEDNKSSKKK